MPAPRQCPCISKVVCLTPSPSSLEAAWCEAELPEEALRDLSDRAEHFESLLAPQEVIPERPAAVPQLAAAARSESNEVLSLAEEA
jgi:hypothetical protein